MKFPCMAGAVASHALRPGPSDREPLRLLGYLLLIFAGFFGYSANQQTTPVKCDYGQRRFDNLCRLSPSMSRTEMFQLFAS